MYEGHTIAVTVPAYNESDAVGGVIESIPEFVDRIYVVDDGSTDDTWRVIREHADARNERDSPDTLGLDETVVPIRHEENRGVGGAITTGYRRALEDGIDVTAVMAGDGQMNPDSLEQIVAPVAAGRADYVKKNRFLRPEDRTGMPRFRVFGTVVLTGLTRIASGYWETGDPQNGYTAISHDALDRLDLDALYEGYGFVNDLLIRLNVADCRVAEVAGEASYSYDADWSSDIEYARFVPCLSWLLVDGFCWRLREKYLVRGFHPLAGGYLLGAGGMATSAAGALAPDRDGESGAAGWLAAFLVGALLFLFGAALDERDNDGLAARVPDSDRPGAAEATGEPIDGVGGAPSEGTVVSDD